MEQFWNYLSIAAVALYSVGLVLIYSHFKPNRRFNWIRFSARVAVFSAIATILYVVPVFQIKLPIFPSFMSFHIDEVPAFIAGYAYGPFVSVMVILVKSVIKLPMSSTAGIGELADFLLSLAFLLPSTWIYKKIRSLKGVLIGFSLGVLLQIVVAMILNVYLILPFYMNVVGLPYENILKMCQVANPNVSDLGWTYAFFIVLPFNLLKNVAVFAITFLVYRSIRKSLHWEKAPKAIAPSHEREE